MNEHEFSVKTSKRIAATFLDSIILLVFNLIFFIILSLLISDFVLRVEPYFMFIISIIWVGIPSFLELLPKRQTLGKMACKIYVKPKISRLCTIKIILRNLVKYAPVLVLASIVQDGIDIQNYFLIMLVYRYIGVLKLCLALMIVLIDLVVMNVSAKGSSLHDKISGTMVVEKMDTSED